jgi:hypothetical protein
VALLEKRRFLYNHSGDFPQVILIIPSHVPNNIFVQVVKAQVGQKGELKDSVSRDYCYLCVNIIGSYICLGSNHQLRSRGPTMFEIKMQFGTT